MRDLLAGWCAANSRADELGRTLNAVYKEPHRRYHSVAHIEHCLSELARVKRNAVHPDEVKWALLFHDAIYDPRRDDNEARSAEWACQLMAELGRPEEATERVRRMILATSHAAEAQTPDQALLLDIDLAILGADEAVFDAYDRAVREEYAHLSEEAYRKGRAEILRSFLRREPLFHTAPFRERYETRARANIDRALARLLD